MRVKYYKRLFGQMSYKKPFVFIIIFSIFITLLYSYFINQVGPLIKTLCDTRAKAIALKVTNETIKEYMTDLTYENLMQIKTGENGKITGLSADTLEMNKLSVKISYGIQEKLMNIEDIEIVVPIGKLLGWSIFSGYGPKINVKMTPTGNVTTDFKTEFKSEGINQTRHRIYIAIKTSVRMVTPFVSDTVTFEENLTVAETVIVGDTPATYYNLNGIESFVPKDSLNLMK